MFGARVRGRFAARVANHVMLICSPYCAVRPIQPIKRPPEVYPQRRPDDRSEPLLLHQHFPSIISQSGPQTALAIWDNGDGRILDPDGEECISPGTGKLPSYPLPRYDISDLETQSFLSCNGRTRPNVHFLGRLGKLTSRSRRRSIGACRIPSLFPREYVAVLKAPGRRNLFGSDFADNEVN